MAVYAKPVADSVGVENQNGKKIILHKLAPKDNYYAIGRRYNVNPKAIIKFNNNAKMTIGNIIKVPTDRPFNEQAPVNQVKATQPSPTKPIKQEAEKAIADNKADAPTQYKVSAGETLYSIAKRFNTTVEAIAKLNNLRSNTITPGETLIIKSNTPAPVIPAPAPSIVAKRDSTSVAMGQDSSGIAHHVATNRYGISEKEEKGVATWMDDEGLDANKKLVLHRTAPIGTVIKITNIMSNKTTFAKVVGRFTDNEQTKDVIIVMTKNVAQALGALDKRFQVTLNYAPPAE